MEFPVSVVGGHNLRVDQGIKRHFPVHGGLPQWPMHLPIVKFANWCYLSRRNIFLAPESKKIYILVDNRPWLQDLISHPAHLWQLMVTKSRVSPFANTRGKDKRPTRGAQAKPKPNEVNSEEVKRWVSVVDASTLSRKSALLPVKKLKVLSISSNLNRTLYGFIVFEVAWSDVRGINYCNELQTDASFALEAKFMRRWEFDSMTQAARCIRSWFSGTHAERSTMTEYLDPTIGEEFYDAQVNFLRTSVVDTNDATADSFSNGAKYICTSKSCSVLPETIKVSAISSRPSTTNGPCKRRKTISDRLDNIPDDYCSEQTPYSSTFEDDIVEATKYKDILILFRFNDRDLPFKLKDTIMSDLRLLTLLECGLPSWVIFLQSYPGLCHIYRPWMCPLARFLYVLISVITVLIGFYDLYKNVPLIKSAASHVFGPFFDWIETWEMISRIRYLGTMLFLHNFEKAFKWFLSMTRTVQSFLSILTQPFTGPFSEFLEFFLPFWNFCDQAADSLFSMIWLVLESLLNLVGNIIEVLLFPVWCILSVFGTVRTCLLYPIRLVMGCYSLSAGVCSFMHEVIVDLWMFSSSILRLTSEVESTVTSAEVSAWRSLWNDLFSQIFRALRSILNGLVAFLMACNRHRLSIYNHTKELIKKLSQSSETSQLTVYSGHVSTTQALEDKHVQYQHLRESLESHKLL